MKLSDFIGLLPMLSYVAKGAGERAGDDDYRYFASERTVCLDRAVGATYHYRFAFWVYSWNWNNFVGELKGTCDAWMR